MSNPDDRWMRNKGPLPDVDGGYRWGFMNGRLTGYEEDRRPSFDPGKWRLDLGGRGRPWEVENRNCDRRATVEVARNPFLSSAD